MIKEIVILAKSEKHGYCVAGVDISTGEWVRPISTDAANEGSVPLCDITYADGNEVQIFDKVKIKLVSHNPTNSQPENYIYDSTVKWKKTGVSSLYKVIKFRGYDDIDLVFYNTRKDVEEDELNGQPSLLLLNVEESCIFTKTFDDGNTKVQFDFKYNDENYNYFKISDKVIKSEFLHKSDGTYNRRQELSVVFSLTGKFHRTGKYYKMVAQMFY